MKKEKTILFLLVLLTTIIGTYQQSKATGQLDVLYYCKYLTRDYYGGFINDREM